MNINRFEVSKIFDSVVGDVDIRVEQFIIENIHNVLLIDEINSWREVWIKEIRESEAYCLSFLDNEHQPLPNEQRIRRYCFLVESFLHTIESGQFPWRLVSTDKYWTSEQVTCFQQVLNFTPYSELSLVNHSLKLDRKAYTLPILDALFLGVQVDSKCKFSYLTINNNMGLFGQNWAIGLEIIKAPTEQLISFNELTIKGTIRSIKPEAQFLFSNLSRLVIEMRSFSSNHYSSLCHTISEFKKWSVFRDSFSIELRFSRFGFSRNGKPYLLDQSKSYKPVSTASKKQFVSIAAKSNLTSLELIWSTLVDLVPLLSPTNRILSWANRITNAVDRSPWPQLKELTIFSFDQVKIDSRIMRSFPSLEKLVIYQSKETDFIDIDEDAFAGAVHLTCLKVIPTHFKNGHCRFTGETFRSLVNLKQLQIRLDTKESVQKLRWLAKLVELNLYGSSIAHIGSNTFCNLPKLEKLNLVCCSISKIDPDAFNRLFSLRELDLCENKALTIIDLKCAVPRILRVNENDSLSLLRLNSSNSTKSVIEELSLSSHSGRFKGALVDISSGLLHGIRKLNVKLMRGMSFIPFAGLDSLDVCVRVVKCINRGRLASLGSLQQLRLSFDCYTSPNEIKADDRLCGQDFAGLVSLKMLTIIGCTNFNEIKQGFFECMPNLQSICLEHCPIDSIQPGAFICVPEIKRLEIKNCDLLKECVSLSELTKLEMLDLSGNKIMSLNKLSADLDHLRSMNTSLKVLSLENNQLSSLDAGAFARLSALTVLDLTCNHIKTIEPGAFSGLVNLRELFLNKNSLNEPFDLSLVFDPDLINLKAVDLRCTRISRINLGWPYVYFQAVTMSGDVKNKFTRFKYNISLYLDSSYLLSGGEILTELSEKGLILLNKESIKFLSYF